MDRWSDPAAVAYLVGVELAARRERLRKRVAESAVVLKCSPAKISNMENGRTPQRPDEVETLLRFYGASQVDVDRLCSLAASAGDLTWWAPWTDVVPDWLKTFVGLEGLAESAQIYVQQLLPALLQTASYSLAVTEGDRQVRPDHNERLAGLRQARQERVTTGENPLLVEAFIEQSALERPVSNSEVMAEQYVYLLELMRRENVIVRLLPTNIGRHDATVGRFTVLNFASANSVAYIEMLHGAVYVQDQEQVAGYSRTIDHLRGLALDPDATAEAIRILAGRAATEGENQ